MQLKKGIIEIYVLRMDSVYIKFINFLFVVGISFSEKRFSLGFLIERYNENFY